MYLGEIPQVPHTLGYVGGAQMGGINERQVGVAETTFGGAPSLQKQPGALVDYAMLLQLALQRAYLEQLIAKHEALYSTFEREKVLVPAEVNADEVAQMLTSLASSLLLRPPLPDELLERVMAVAMLTLDLRSLGELARTCKAFRAALLDERNWAARYEQLEPVGEGETPTPLTLEQLREGRRVEWQLTRKHEQQGGEPGWFEHAVERLRAERIPSQRVQVVGPRGLTLPARLLEMARIVLRVDEGGVVRPLRPLRLALPCFEGDSLTREPLSVSVQLGGDDPLEVERMGCFVLAQAFLWTGSQVGRRFLALVHRNGELWVARYLMSGGSEVVRYLHVDAARLVGHPLDGSRFALRPDDVWIARLPYLPLALGSIFGFPTLWSAGDGVARLTPLHGFVRAVRCSRTPRTRRSGRLPPLVGGGRGCGRVCDPLQVRVPGRVLPGFERADAA